MTVWPDWNQIFADVFIDLMEQSVLFLRICFQQDINQVIFQYPYAQRPVHHHFMLPVFFFLIQLRFRVTDDVFRKVTDIDCAVDILQQQNRPGPCEVLYLDRKSVV